MLSQNTMELVYASDAYKNRKVNPDYEGMKVTKIHIGTDDYSFVTLLERILNEEFPDCDIFVSAAAKDSYEYFYPESSCRLDQRLFRHYTFEKITEAIRIAKELTK